MQRLLICCGLLLMTTATVAAQTHGCSCHTCSTPECVQSVPVKERTCLQCVNLANICPKSLRERKSRVVISEQPPHFPYQALNLYYYDRPYQFAKSREPIMAKPGTSEALNATMDQVYERMRAINTPDVGNANTLEFADLPGTAQVAAEHLR